MPDDAYAIVNPDAVKDDYAGTEVPGEFRRLTAALGAEQLAATLIRIPPHSDFEQGSGHFHAIDRGDATKIDEFWEASPAAAQHR